MTTSNLLQTVRTAVECNDARAVQHLIDTGFKDPQNLALIDAIEYNHLECVRALIRVGEPRLHESFVLRFATELNRVECVKELVAVCQAEDALLDAVNLGHVECLQHIIPMCDPHWLDEAFVYAIKHRYPNCVESARLLIEFADKRGFEGHALTAAVLNSTTDMVDFLFDKCNPKVALSNLKREWPNTPEIWEHLESKIQAARITQQISIPTHCVAKKM